MPQFTFLERLALAFYAFIAVLTNDEAAKTIARLREPRRGVGPGGAGPVEPGRETLTEREAPKPAAQERATAPVAVPPPPPPKATTPKMDSGAALQLLTLLQKEGRLVDFVEEDLAGFPDAAIGKAARTVHAGCKRVLNEVFRLEPVLGGAEGAQVTVERGFDPSTIRLLGKVAGEAPFKGALRHHGWRAREVKVPPRGDGPDPTLVAPAEVDVGSAGTGSPPPGATAR